MIEEMLNSYLSITMREGMFHYNILGLILNERQPTLYTYRRKTKIYKHKVFWKDKPYGLKYQLRTNK